MSFEPDDCPACGRLLDNHGTCWSCDEEGPAETPTPRLAFFSDLRVGLGEDSVPVNDPDALAKEILRRWDMPALQAVQIAAVAWAGARVQFATQQPEFIYFYIATQPLDWKHGDIDEPVPARTAYRASKARA
ncbi:hypothetical protein [Deinococcus sp. QL22]|uniref:hypothetical protein n=1 Tax=Deinococcus sp. QL22 TaxID=2939437 RepID=UPI00201719B9|nr:hypothetical protein [Deinococcus sp. QL22]UQN10293.1 hypothetical protein M1R55_29520 [Deinococcus sp. QL22]UQN10427.1 hypothetical protein M1R55_28845 [Deinococcus sp. QL22]